MNGADIVLLAMCCLSKINNNAELIGSGSVDTCSQSRASYLYKRTILIDYWERSIDNEDY